MMDWFRLIVVFWWWRWFSPSDGWVLRKSDQGWAVTVGPLVKPCSHPPAVKDGPRSRLQQFHLLTARFRIERDKRVPAPLVVRGA